MNSIIKYIYFLIWGSFLNVVAYRLIHDNSSLKAKLFSRSRCPHCITIIKWYDNIPLISWLLLRAQCRNCQKPISALYPFIELLTATVLTFMCLNTPTNYHLAYFIFFSALIVTIRTDLESMLISRYATVFLIPFALLFSTFNLLPISTMHSMLGALTGYCFLLCTAKIFTYFTGKHGIGQGDLDLLSFIGAFTGIVGWWASVALGSVCGSVIGLIYIGWVRPTGPVKIPFGPFLAGGALMYILYERAITHLLLGI